MTTLGLNTTPESTSTTSLSQEPSQSNHLGWIFFLSSNTELFHIIRNNCIRGSKHRQWSCTNKHAQLGIHNMEDIDVVLQRDPCGISGDEFSLIFALVVLLLTPYSCDLCLMYLSIIPFHFAFTIYKGLPFYYTLYEISPGWNLFGFNGSFLPLEDADVQFHFISPLFLKMSFHLLKILASEYEH